MPLSDDPSAKGVSQNIRELYEANKSKPAHLRRPRKQIIAIALSHAREARKNRRN
jgi:hypothetical protein